MAKIVILLSLLAIAYCWDYSEQYDWPETCLTGQYQSPININKLNENPESEIKIILEYKWGDFGAPRMLDNGHYLIVFFIE